MSTIHTLLPSNAQIENSLEALRRATDPLLGAITHFKEQFAAIDKHGQALFAISQKVLATLDEEINKEMKRFDAGTIPAAKKETVRKEEKKCADLQSLQCQTKATSKVSVKIPNRHQSGDNKQAPTNKAYICFLCLRENLKQGVKNSYIWHLDTFYLNHLQDRHSIRPDFQVLRLGTFKSIPFSHVFLNNSLVNLLKGLPLEPLVQSLCLWEHDSKDKICICSCALKQTATSFDKLPIYSSDADLYIDHVKTAHNGICQPSSSHKIVNRHNITYISKFGNSVKDPIYTQPKIIAAFQQLPGIVDGMTDFAVESLLVEAEPEIRLELISKMRVSWNDVFFPLPGCYKSTPTLSDMKEYIERHENSLPKLAKFQDLSQEETDLINLQLSLLKPSVFICGECLNIVSHDRLNFIAHITQKHDQINPLNSHVFTFLKQ